MLRTSQPARKSLLALMTALSLAACNQPGTTPGNGVTKVMVTPDPARVVINKTTKLNAAVEGTGTFSKAVVWKSADNTVATVTADGIVTARKVGQTTITATSSSDATKVGEARVQVITESPGTVTTVTVTPPAATITAGSTETLTATVTGTGGYTTGVTWTSSNANVATVSSTGIVTALAPGQATITAKSTFDASKSGSAQITVGASTSKAKLSLQNVDGGPFTSWMSFSKVGSGVPATPSATEHNVSTVRLTNTGTEALNVSLKVTGNFTLLSGAAPLQLAPGASSDVRVRFIGEGERVQRGTLVISSNDPAAPNTTIQLAGAWQMQYENNQEPTLSEIVNGTLGFKTALTSGGQSIDQKGRVTAQGDEVLSAYWQRADTTQPVNVWQLASYHTQGNPATLSWHPKANTTTSSIVTSAGTDAQSVLPRISGGSGLARQNFTPGDATFGFRVDGNEWSDPTRNSQSKDLANGCTAPCGHHLRFYKAKDPSGQPMPDTYLLVMDYAGINYDYNDNVFLITNIRPAPLLIDTGLGAGAQYVAPDGSVWMSDRDRTGFATFSPDAAFNEPTTAFTGDIANTEMDPLYRTYRGNTSKATPDTRTLSYTFPLENGTYQLKLHFADLAASHTAPNQRVFDVLVDGQVRIDNLDIVRETGAPFAALVKPLTVQVTGGKLNLAFAASVDYPSISGIEITR